MNSWGLSTYMHICKNAGLPWLVLGAWQLCMLAKVANTLVDGSQEPMHTVSSGLLFPGWVGE